MTVKTVNKETTIAVTREVAEKIKSKIRTIEEQSGCKVTMSSIASRILLDNIDAFQIKLVVY